VATGDYRVVRNNANTDEIPNAASGDLLCLWDTPVAQVGSGISSGSDGTFVLGETGHFLVLVSEHVLATSTANVRQGGKMTLTLAGTELIEGCSSWYLRKQSGHQDQIVFGAAVINVATTTGTGDELEVRLERVDNITTAGEEADRAANAGSSVTIIKLDDSWNYGRYESSATYTESTTHGVAVTANLVTAVEEDTGAFNKTTSTISVDTPNLVLAVHSSRGLGLSTRTQPQTRLNFATAGIVPGSHAQCYVRNSNGINWGGMSNVVLLEDFVDGDNIELELRMLGQNGGNSWESTLQLVELPAGAEACILEATSGDFHTETVADFVQDTNPYIDTAAFTSGTSQANIDVDNDGDYLCMSSQAYTTTTLISTNRAEAGMTWGVGSVDQNIGAASSFVRGNNSTSHPAIASGVLLTGLSATNSITVRNLRINTTPTIAATCNDGAFSVIRLSSLFGVTRTSSGTPSLTKPTSAGFAGLAPKVTVVDGDDIWSDGDSGLVATGTDFV